MDDILAYSMVGVVAGGVLGCLGTLLYQIFRDDCMSERLTEQQEYESQQALMNQEDSDGLETSV